MSEIYSICKKIIDIQKQNLQVEINYHTNIINLTEFTMTYGLDASFTDGEYKVKYSNIQDSFSLYEEINVHKDQYMASYSDYDEIFSLHSKLNLLFLFDDLGMIKSNTLPREIKHISQIDEEYELYLKLQDLI